MAMMIIAAITGIIINSSDEFLGSFILTVVVSFPRVTRTIAISESPFGEFSVA